MSILIRIDHKKVADLPTLMRLALRYVYEKKTMKAADISLMERSIIGWSKKVLPTQTEKDVLQRIGWMLQKDKEGKFDRRKELFKEKGIDWRKFHKLREAFV